MRPPSPEPAEFTLPRPRAASGLRLSHVIEQSNRSRGRAWVLALLLLLGCGAAGANRPGGGDLDVQDLVPYQGALAVLYDDGIDPEVLGASDNGVPADRDPRLIERLRTADIVVPVVVATSTQNSDRNSAAVELILRPSGPPLLGAAPEDLIHVVLSPNSPSFSLVVENSDALMGAHLILFETTFAEGGRAVAHWHAKPDTPAVRAAIQRDQANIEMER